MYIVLIVFHVVACLILIATILLQAGKGGGLTEAFGGGETAQSVLGTQAPNVLKKATTISAIIFMVASLTLGAVTSRRGRSLFDAMNLPGMPVAATSDGVTVTIPEVPFEEAVQEAAEEVPVPVVPVEEAQGPVFDDTPVVPAEEAAVPEK